jgi:excinuclease UvrABC ATPase subunit
MFALLALPSVRRFGHAPRKETLPTGNSQDQPMDFTDDGSITIRGARENNLNDVSLRIPKRKITIFTGVSGSGKSSIVFDTIATEARRQLYENFSFFIRGLLPRCPRPEADSIENINMAVIVDQKPLGGGSHSTVGTVTDIYTLLRLLFSRVGEPSAGPAAAFSFNDSRGWCSECSGLGRKVGVVSDDFLDLSKSLNEGAVQVPFFASWELACYAASGFLDNDKKLRDFTRGEMDLLLYGKNRKFKLRVGTGKVTISYVGVLEKIERAYIRRDIKTLSERIQKAVSPYLRPRPCPLCKGARLSQPVLASRINGHNIADLNAMEIDELISVIRRIKKPVAAPIVTALAERLDHLSAIGLGYLSLNREIDTLSGGESQRVKMVKQLGSSLVDVLYIFDEPSVGLHPRDVHRLNELLQKLRDKGNSVLVVEHDPDVIRRADHIIDVGPGAGTSGGKIVFEGTYNDLLKADTLTARFLQRALAVKTHVRKAKGQLAIKNAKAHNLQNITVDIPVGVLTVITGVAGSGKSTLMSQVFLPQHPQAIVINQAAVGTTARSNPATYTGVMDDIRKAFAAANEVDAGLFSFNSKGACANCKGAGVIYTELAFLEAFKSPCETCEGRRFRDDVLAYKLHGKSIHDVLVMTVAQALAFFMQKNAAREPRAGGDAGLVRKLRAMGDVGLDYLTLGQPLSTLSGGECQRIKLASELHKTGGIYVLDEPTTGLHMSDITRLLAILNRIVDLGNTVIFIEHNLDVIRNADWIIDLGPEGGSKGGRVVFTGTPGELMEAEESLTGKYLRGNSRGPV